MTNGTLPIPAYCSPYIVFAPQIVGQMIEDKGRPLTKNEIYSIKNIKHRNITLSPEDIGADYKICYRINICGIHYTVYGFSYTAPCFPCIMAKQSNHKYFLHEFPKDVSMFIRENFKNDVCSLCTYAIENYKMYANEHPEFQTWNYCGTKWKELIFSNKVKYVEPDTSWINKV